MSLQRVVGRALPARDAGVAPVARLLAWALIASTTVLTLPRLTPTWNGDFGAFVSVAERIGSGDRLYADVWDNKDPYFYYSLALAGNLGWWGYFVLELIWVGLAVFGLAQLGHSQGLSRGWSVVVAWGIAPWCLLGATYIGTMSAMPGVALVFAVLALADRRRWASVGLLLGVLLLLKVIFVPVAIAGATVLCTDARRRACLAAVAGAAGSVSVGVVALAVRGELPGYLAMLPLNSQYAARMVDDGGLAGFVDHLSLALVPFRGHPGARIAVGAIVVCVAVAAAAAWRTRAASSRLAVCAGVVAVSCVVVLGLTGVWEHHSQVLAIPACLALLALCVSTPPRGTAHHLALVPAFLAAAYLVGGATPFSQLVITPTTAAEPLRQFRGDSPEATSIATDDSVTTYSRLGRNDLSAHARGLDSLALACRDFQQYPFNPQSTFTRMLECLPRSDVVFVFYNFADQPGPSSYVRFTQEAMAILGDQFQCTATVYGQKCLRNGR